jgi:hypothetical protein
LTQGFNHSSKPVTPRPPPGKAVTELKFNHNLKGEQTMGEKKQRKQKDTLGSKIDMMGRRHLINSEYRRGFLEGQRHALQAFAGLIDVMTIRQEQVAANSSVNLNRQEIKFT